MSLSILYVGPRSGTSGHRHDAFIRLGHRVKALDPRQLLPRSGWIDRIEWHLSPNVLAGAVRRSLESELSGSRYDVAFVDNGSLISASAVRVLKSHCLRVVNFNHDDPYGHRDRARFSAYRTAVPEYDLIVVVRPCNVQEAIAAGARRVLKHPMVADEVAHAPREITPAIESAWRSEVSFVGSWMPERGGFLVDLLRRGVPLALYGPGWSKAPEWPQLRSHHRAEYLDGDSYAYAIQCSRVNLGLLSLGNRDQHTTRSFEIPSLGGLLCAQRTTEHLEFYQDGIEALFWDDAEECAHQCLRALADPRLCDEIARRGRLRHLRNGYTSEGLLSAILAEVA